MSLIVTGTIGIDDVATPDGQSRERVLGGSGVYFAAAASFHTRVRLVAAVGDDFPSEFADTIAGFSNIDTAGLETRAGSKTFRWGGKYLEDMDHRETTFTELNILEEEPPKVPDSFRDSQYVFLANGHPATQRAFLGQLPQRRLVVADTMDLWIDIARDDLTALLGEVDGLVLNYDEAEHYTHTRNPVTAGRKLLTLGPRFVVVKKGEHGCILVHKDGISALPAYPAESVVDPTGAGDSFAGGMMGALAEAGGADPGSFESVHRALAYGTVMASFTIESFTLDRLRTLEEEELKFRFDVFSRMLRVG